jgi:hypothetical protein
MRTSTKLKIILQEHELRVSLNSSGMFEIVVTDNRTGDAFIAEGKSWSLAIERVFRDKKYINRE